MNLFLKRLWLQVSADRRKFGALCAMIGIGLLLWARIIVINNMPRTAIADDAPLLAELASENDVADDASEPIEPAIEVELASQANRDPFVISGARFPREVVPSDIATDQGKSDLDRSEDPMQAQARLIAQLGVLVDRLALEAVMMGRPPYAVIDGQTWTIGDLVPAGDVRSVMFELTDIRERVVTLETEGLRFELRIPAPSGG